MIAHAWDTVVRTYPDAPDGVPRYVATCACGNPGAFAAATYEDFPLCSNAVAIRTATS